MVRIEGKENSNGKIKWYKPESPEKGIKYHSGSHPLGKGYINSKTTFKRQHQRLAPFYNGN